MNDVNVLLAQVLSYLANTLPPPLYSFVINAFSHVLTLSYATFDLISTLISKNPLEWDLQTVLPPLITLFAAYFALLSFYRTTTWLLRMSIFFVKWGTLFGIIIACAAWFTGNQSTLGRYSGVVSTLGNFILDAANDPKHKHTGHSPSGSRKQKARPQEFEKPKPGIWDSFERHREWQHKQTQEDVAAADAQRIIDGIIGNAGNLVRENGWWKVVKDIVVGISEKAQSSDGRETAQSSRDSQLKTKSGHSRSR
ncbi:hypothetical protein C0993_006671 [Termitomyces sp. T159_Od127]|nr:hypothetical protein C0993_006671 [Termitomyces sp. T159_Od127]